MKVLFNNHTPFNLAHGGAQIQIERTRHALEQVGVEVEPLRWWDSTQTGDVLHHFGRMPVTHVELARAKGMKVVMSDLLTGQGSRPVWRVRLQSPITRMLRRFGPHSIRQLLWDMYREVDACVALTPWEAELMVKSFDAPKDRVHVVPNGVEDVFLNRPPAARGEWLVCTAIITERKRVLELAQAAVAAQTPLWVIGKPYAGSDSYAMQFLELTRSQPKILRYEGPVADRQKLAGIYREARGFVLLSTMESLSLSALEAAACECPLLLSDQPWARTVFQAGAEYCPVPASAARTAAHLRKFYDAAPALKPPPKPLTWLDVGRQIKAIYDGLLNTSR